MVDSHLAQFNQHHYTVLYEKNDLELFHLILADNSGVPANNTAEYRAN